MKNIGVALRGLRRSPTFTLVTLLLLALGLGATLSVFTIVDTVLLRRLPFKNPDALVKIWETAHSNHSWVSPANFHDWSTDAKLFKGMSAYYLEDLAVSGKAEPRLVRGVSVSPGLLDMMGVKPLLGHNLGTDSSEVDDGRFVVIGENYWRRELGADPGVVGSVLTIEGAPHKVVGVLPAGFSFPERTEMWRPMVLKPAQWGMRGAHYLDVVGRLGSGVSRAQASAELRTIASGLAQQYPGTNAGSSVELVPLHEELVGQLRPALLVLAGAVEFVLLAVCANLICMLLARNAARQRETAIRLTLGAGRGRLIGHLCTEATILTLAGGALGLLLAQLVLRLFTTFKPAGLSQIGDLAIDGRVLVFGLLLSLAAGLLSGLVPALLTARWAPDAELMREGEWASGSRHSRRLQSLFVIGQVTLALVLAVGAGLLSRSFGQIEKVDPGFNPKGVVALTITLPKTGYSDRTKQSETFRRIVEQVKGVPTVESAAVVTTLPLSGAGMGFEFEIVSRPAQSKYRAAYDAVSPEYFAAMRIQLKRGRLFQSQDDAKSSPVALINETLAHRLWRGEDPIGERLSIGDLGPNPREIVGVIADVRHKGLDSEPRGEIYVPQEQAGWSVMTLVVRSRESPGPLLHHVQRAIWSVDRTLPVSQEAAVEKILADSVSQRRFNALVLEVFAGLAVFLAILGVYGLLTQAVIERRREIGIRMALGAGSGDISRQVLGQGLGLVGTGVGIGILAALFLSRLLAGFLFQVSTTDPLTLVAVSLAILCVSVGAGLIPALRAARVDPLISMRSN